MLVLRLTTVMLPASNTMSDQATIPVKRDTKEELQRIKRTGLTWDAFMNDLAEAYKEQ